MDAQNIAAGTVIFKEGDAPDYAYLILSGKVEILKKTGSGDVKLAEIGPGQVFGEMALFDHNPRAASARAVEAVQLDRISPSEIEQLVGQCPERIRPVIHTAFDRLRQMNKRVSEHEKATTVVECDFETITLSPLHGTTKCEFAPVEVKVTQLPFVVGGYPLGDNLKQESKSRLYIPCEGPPLAVSRDHLRIEMEDNSVCLRDMGSRFGTQIDGMPIGRGKGIYKISLNKGERKIMLGDPELGYGVLISCA